MTQHDDELIAAPGVAGRAGELVVARGPGDLRFRLPAGTP
jgi:hypothetical protein